MASRRFAAILSFEGAGAFHEFEQEDTGNLLSSLEDAPIKGLNCPHPSTESGTFLPMEFFIIFIDHLSLRFPFLRVLQVQRPSRIVLPQDRLPFYRQRYKLLCLSGQLLLLRKRSSGLLSHLFQQVGTLHVSRVFERGGLLLFL